MDVSLKVAVRGCLLQTHTQPARTAWFVVPTIELEKRHKAATCWSHDHDPSHWTVSAI